MNERGAHDERELLVILGGAHAADARDRIRKDHRVSQQASPRVIVVDCERGDETRVGAIPGVMAVARGDVPSDALEGLDGGERLFVRGWIARMRELPSKRRRGEGAAWDAPGFRPPDPKKRRSE